MLWKILLFLAFVPKSSSQDNIIPIPTKDFECIKVNGKFQEGYFPKSTSCSQYFICDSFGEAYEADCGEFGSFDPDSQTCKLNSEVRCLDGLRGEQVQETTTKSPPLTTATTEEPIKEENSAEATVEPTTPVTEKPEVIPDIPAFANKPLYDRKDCEDRDDGKYLVINSLCSRYFECRLGKSTHLASNIECPAHTTFDEKNQECIHTHRNSDVRCPGSPLNAKLNQEKYQKVELDPSHFLLDYDGFVIPEDEAEEKETEAFCSRPENGGKQMTVDESCYKFRVCEIGLGARIYDCPPFTTFDDQVRDCVTFGTTSRSECREQEADLDDIGFSCPSAGDLSAVIEQRLDYTGERSYATFPDPKDCAKFFLCYLEAGGGGKSKKIGILFKTGCF